MQRRIGAVQQKHGRAVTIAFIANMGGCPRWQGEEKRGIIAIFLDNCLARQVGGNQEGRAEQQDNKQPNTKNENVPTKRAIYCSLSEEIGSVCRLRQAKMPAAYERLCDSDSGLSNRGR